MQLVRRFGVEIEAVGVTATVLRTALRNAGFEAEAARYGERATPYWKVSRDGSLVGQNSFELVSPVLSGETGLMELYTAVKITQAKGATVNRTCGLHVHVEVADFDLTAFKRLVKSYANNEDVFDALMPQSRRASSNRYSGSLFGLTANMTDAERVEAAKRFFDAVDACNSVRALIDLLGTRYRKLNLAAFLEHGTVEFRQHSGTVSPDKVVNWVRFCQAFVEHAHKAKFIRPWGENKMSKTERLRTVLRMMGAMDLYPYYRDRIRELKTSTE